MRVFILDEIVVKPGLASTYRSAYRERYIPAAERRRMRLEGTWQSPPVTDIDELPTTLYYLWSVAGAEGWWSMRLSRRPDGRDERFDKQAWWEESDQMTLSRKRTVLSAQPEDG
ncbi:MAG TPA: hypothetical protein VLX59_15620 [Acidimicrobiales bacterium]|nr:hypothetical protein [Acidimicrobiales bacterium]